MALRKSSLLLIVLLALGACGEDSSEVGVSTQASGSDGFLVTPCPVLENARSLQPDFREQFVEQTRSQLMDLASQELVEIAVNNLQRDEIYGRAFTKGEFDVIISIRDGSGARIHVLFNEPVDLPPDLGLPVYGGEQISDEDRLDSDGQIILKAVEDERIFNGVKAAEFAVDSAGSVVYIIPSQEELWCRFDPEDLLQGEG